jgi:aminopeptidase N
MRFLILFLSLVLISSGIQSQNCQHQIHQNQNLKKLYPRNLDYAIKHYDLFFDFHKKAQGEIDAVAQIEMYFLNDVSEVELDIKSYTIDQVKLDGQQLVFSSSDSLLRISPSLGFEKSDTVMIEVSYSGSTHREALQLRPMKS